MKTTNFKPQPTPLGFSQFYTFLAILFLAAFFSNVNAQTCSAPASLTVSSVTSNTAQFDWPAMSSPVTSYVTRYRIIGSPTWSNAGSTSNSKYISGLTPAANYEAQVSSYCSSTGTQTSFTSSTYFTTGTACPIPTNLIVNSTTSNSVSVSWDDMGLSASSYIIRYRIIGAGSWSSSSSTTYSKTITGLSAATNYEVQVSSYCSASGVQTAYTASENFTTDAPCPIPTGLAYSNATSNSVDVSWDNMGISVTSYILQFREVGTTTWSNSSSTSITKTITGLSASTNYEVQLSSYCSASGTQTAYTSSLYFTTDIPCPPPSGISISGIYANGFTVSWNSLSAPATSNILRYREIGTSTWINGSSSTTSKFINGLNPLTNYEVQVSTYCAAGSVQTAYSSSVNTSTNNTSCPNPSLITLATSANSTSIVGNQCVTETLPNGASMDFNNATCNAVLKISDNTSGSGIGSTQVCVTVTSTLPSKNNGQVYAPRYFEITPGSSEAVNVVFYLTSDDMDKYNAANGSLLEMPVNALDPNWANVKVAQITGGTLNTGTITSITPISVIRNGGVKRWEITVALSSPQGLFYFYTDPLCNNSMPAATISNVTSSAAQFDWTSLGAGYNYEWRYRVQGISSWTLAGAGTSSNTRVFTGLDASTTYEFQGKVRCVSSASSGLWGNTETFTTLSVTPCPVPTNLTAGTITANQASFSWDDVSTATSGNKYIARYRLSPSGSWINAGCPAASKTIYGLTANTDYDFEVQSVCLAGVLSNYTSTMTFTTAAMRQQTQQSLVLQMYPNPVSELFNLDIYQEKSNPMLVKIIDITGRLVKQTQFQTVQGQQQIQLDVRNCPIGLFTVQVYENNQLIHVGKMEKIQ